MTIKIIYNNEHYIEYYNIRYFYIDKHFKTIKLISDTNIIEVNETFDEVKEIQVVKEGK